MTPLTPRKPAPAPFPYRSSINSMSVKTFDRRQRRAKINRDATEPGIKNHHCQFPEIPYFLTRPVTKRGVSAAKDVAMSEVPANHHGSDLPERKKFSIVPEAFLENQRPTQRTR